MIDDLESLPNGRHLLAVSPVNSCRRPSLATTTMLLIAFAIEPSRLEKGRSSMSEWTKTRWDDLPQLPPTGSHPADHPWPSDSLRKRVYSKALRCENHIFMINAMHRGQSSYHPPRAGEEIFVLLSGRARCESATK